MDDCVLEIVDLLTGGITSYNLKYHIPSDLPLHNQYIPAHNLKSQNWLDDIHKWTVNQKMMLNPKKTKNMIFNFTNKYKFSTRLKIDGETIETVSNTRLLGTIIEENTSLAAKGALANRLQRRNACKIQNGCQGAQKWPTGSGKVSTPRFLGILSNIR